MNIYERLSKITEELGFVAKGLTVGKGTNQYKAVSEADVLNAVKPLEIKHGVYSYPMSRDIVFQEILESEKEYTDYKTQEKSMVKKSTYFMRVKTTYRFVNTEKPTEFVDMDTFGDGVDSLDKAPGKAMTYADKYALLKAYKIQTGDDPDANHSNERTVSRKKVVKKPVKPVEDLADTYKKILDLQLSAEDVSKWETYYKVSSLFDLDSEQMNFILERFSKRLGK